MRVSLLVPLRANGPRDVRLKNWKWLKERWSVLLPEAELCMGTDDGGHPFSKSVAVNDAYSKSTGELLVIADADSWVERPQLIQGLERAASYEHLVVPWWTAYRFGKEDSNAIMASDPLGPNPVTLQMKENAAGTGPSPASAAMVLCIQRVAFERVGGWDPRFRGWGSEDVSFGYTTWTLLGRNEYSMGEAYALYHPQPKNSAGMRTWKGEGEEIWRNRDIYERYRKAQGRPQLMEFICKEHPLKGSPTPIGKSPTWKDTDMVGLPEMDTENPPPGEHVATEQIITLGGERVTI